MNAEQQTAFRQDVARPVAQPANSTSPLCTTVLLVCLQMISSGTWKLFTCGEATAVHLAGICCSWVPSLGQMHTPVPPHSDENLQCLCSILCAGLCNVQDNQSWRFPGDLMVRPEAESSYQDFLPDVPQPFALQGEVEVRQRSHALCSLRRYCVLILELSSLLGYRL